jgi:acetyl-CoA acetyltransferase family protein
MVLIDVDGTLVDSVPDLAFCVDQTMTALGRAPHGEGEVRNWVGNGVPRLIERALVGALDGSPEPALYAEAEPIFLECYAANASTRTRPYDGVSEGLDWLHRQGFKLGQGKLEDLLMASLYDPYCGCFMAQTSNNLANDYGISREDQDRFALMSQQRAVAAIEAGRLAEEIVPVEVGRGKRARTVDRDQHPRPGTTLEGLAALPVVFGDESFVTAGNASGIVDGAAMMVLTTMEAAAGRGVEPLGRLRSWATVGVDPSRMGIGPAPAILKALERAGMQLSDLDLLEINEAFAGQILAVIRELDLDVDKLNVNGGAIALGHPLGATGTRITLTLLKELQRRGGGVGVASACIGGGQGIALIVESG